MQLVNLRSFKQKVRHNRRRFRLFLSRIEKNPPKDLKLITVEADKRAWAEIDCLSCANCCKTMSPTYTAEDIKRISKHLDMTPKAFKDKWLYKDKDWRLDEYKTALPVPEPHGQQMLYLRSTSRRLFRFSAPR